MLKHVCKAYWFIRGCYTKIGIILQGYMHEKLFGDDLTNRVYQRPN